MRKWDVKTGSLLESYKFGAGWIFAMAISPDGKNLAIGTGWSVAIINISTGSSIIFPKVHNKYIKDIAFSPDGKYLATGSHDTIIKYWKLP